MRLLTRKISARLSTRRRSRFAAPAVLFAALLASGGVYTALAPANAEKATDDAATPYAGALELHKALRGSQLVVQDGDRTHCIVHRGDTRPGGVDSYFDAYFLNGALPQQDTTHVSQLGDPTPPAASAAAKRSGTIR